jgi:hypothetical protein
MNILMVSTPATGHINPLLGVARVLIADGHNVVCLSGSALRDRIESAGAGFRALPPAADFDLNEPFATVPEHCRPRRSGDEARDTPEHETQNTLGGARRQQVNPDHRLHLADASSDIDEPQAQRIELRDAPHRAPGHRHAQTPHEPICACVQGTAGAGWPWPWCTRCGRPPDASSRT